MDELSWGQQTIWSAIQHWGPLNLVAITTLPDGTTIADVAKQLAFITGRHQSLRTRLRFTAEGRPQQVLAASGETALEVIDVETVDPVELADRYRRSPFSGDSELTFADPAHPSPEEVAEAVQMRYYDRFDEENEWPLRVAVIRRAGVITHRVLAYNHLIADGEGLAALVRDLPTMDRATGRATAPVAGLTSLEQARRQRTPRHRRHSDVALRHWGRVLRAIPAQRFGGPVEPRQPRFWELEFSSPAAHLAARSVAARKDLSTGPVVLAAFATALHRLTGLSPSVAQLQVSNRFRPGFADSVSAVNQPGLCVIDVAGATFDQVVARAWQTTLTAGLHAYYDVAEWDQLIADISRERGEEIDLSCFYSDRGVAARRDDASLAPTIADIQAALPRTTIRWRRRKETPNDKLYLHVGQSPDTLDLMLAADTMYLSPDDMTGLLRTIEAVLIAAAVDGGPVDGDPVDSGTVDSGTVDRGPVDGATAGAALAAPATI